MSQNKKFYENFNSTNEPKYFSGAIASFAIEQKKELSNEKRVYLSKIEKLGGEAFFNLSDFRNLCGRMSIYFEKWEREMLRNNKSDELSFSDKNLEKYWEEKRRNDILTIKDITKNQINIIALGIFFRVHSFLENIMKTLCINMKGLLGISDNYWDVKYDSKKLSVLEQCVLYLDKLPIDNIIDLKIYDELFEWNVIRNCLIHDGGEITEKNKNIINSAEKIGVNIARKLSRSISISPDGQMTDDILGKSIIELTFEVIVKYIESIDKFIALLVDKNAVEISRTNDEMNGILKNLLEDEEQFKEHFQKAIEGIKEKWNIKDN